jgi:hypothetical protein
MFARGEADFEVFQELANVLSLLVQTEVLSFILMLLARRQKAIWNCLSV